jgi:molybdenum cofactor cytidylyltransferase
MGIAAIILAAGRSTRMGSNKLLEELYGEPLVRLVAKAALASNVHSLSVVTGHQPELIHAALEGLGVDCVHNPNFLNGLSTSLKSGISMLPAEVTGVVILLGDMPMITPDTIDCLIDAFETSPRALAAIPVHRGEWGNPVLLSRALFADVEKLEGDAGARKLLAGRVGEVLEIEVPSGAVLVDLDTPEALAKARIDAE